MVVFDPNSHFRGVVVLRQEVGLFWDGPNKGRGKAGGGGTLYLKQCYNNNAFIDHRESFLTPRSVDL